MGEVGIGIAVRGGVDSAVVTSGEISVVTGTDIAVVADNGIAVIAGIAAVIVSGVDSAVGVTDYAVALADPRALAAADTLALVVEQLGFTPLRLGVVTPKAVERTALQKHRRAYARSVVDREALNIEYCRGYGRVELCG